MSEEFVPRMTHVAVGCGQVDKELDRLIFIGDEAEVDCPECLRILEEHRLQRVLTTLAEAMVDTQQALDSLRLAQRAEGDVNAKVRLNWVQVARNALTNALTTLEEKP